MGPCPDILTILRPDYRHAHFRAGDLLSTTVAHSARCLQRATVMPNLVAPITTIAMALAFRERIPAALPINTAFDPR